MNLKKLKQGEPLTVSASTWNYFVDAANAWKFSTKFQPTNNKIIAPFYKCFISGQYTLGYGDVVVLDQTMDANYLQTNISGSDIKLSYTSNKSLQVRLCQLKDGFKQIGVIQKTSKGNGSIMLTSGLTVVRFQSGKLNASHKRCYCGANGKMISANVGSHKIIKVLSEDTDYSTDDQFALVQINCGLKDSLRCRITASEQLSTRKWLYSWEQIKRNGNSFSGSVSGAMSNTSWAKAINGSQSNNTSGATLQSSGYNFNQQPFLTNTQLDITPIRGQPIVNIYFSIDQTDGTKYADFDMLNIISGNCGEA